MSDIRDRRHTIGGSDARVIMGDDEAALLRLWREKRGEVEPEDLTDNLVVQLGSVTEHLNRHWYEKNSGHFVTEVQRQVFHNIHRWKSRASARAKSSRNDPNKRHLAFVAVGAGVYSLARAT